MVKSGYCVMVYENQRGLDFDMRKYDYIALEPEIMDMTKGVSVTYEDYYITIFARAQTMSKDKLVEAVRELVIAHYEKIVKAELFKLEDLTGLRKDRNGYYAGRRLIATHFQIHGQARRMANNARKAVQNATR